MHSLIFHINHPFFNIFSSNKIFIISNREYSTQLVKDRYSYEPATESLLPSVFLEQKNGEKEKILSLPRGTYPRGRIYAMFQILNNFVTR